MTKFELLAASALTMIAATPALAQSGLAPTQPSAVAQAPSTPAEQSADQTTSTQDAGGTAQQQPANGDIVVTAQRTSQRLQDVPISISAFTGAALEQQQIHNSLDIQQSLPNITFTKTNFTASSFTIRGIGDLCVGFSCDSATGIHINDVPVPATRLFETEFLDLERVEVLRGPQGTLFGRNATSGVVNFITARPDLTGIHSSGSFEYSNYNSKKVQGMINLPLTSTLGVRFAGMYLNRGGYTYNSFLDQRQDGRDLYQVRGSLRWQPSSSTTIDLLGSYFHERDDRARVQNQLCHRDPTGILGCSPDRLANESVNANSNFGEILTSRQFFAIALSPTLAPFGLYNLNTPNVDAFSGSVRSPDLRTVSSNVTPTYFSDELNVQGRLNQEIGGKFELAVIAGYNRARVDSTAAQFTNLPNVLTGNAGIGTFLAAAPSLGLTNARNLAFDPSGNLCASNVNLNYSGVFSGDKVGCFNRFYDYDRSRSKSEGYSVEAHVNSKLDGPFNFLLGGIYLRGVNSGDYFVQQSAGVYASTIIGFAQSTTAASAKAGITPGTVYSAPPYFNSETQRYTLKSYGLFGEGYLNFSDTLKLTVGARYSHDEKFVRDRSPLLSFLAPYGVADAFASPYTGASFDADPAVAGNQLYREQTVSFSRVTGRAVLDWKWRQGSLLYASYSRGYKSGGINPPFDPNVFTAPATFRPESVDSFEIGSKNTLANGKLTLNVSGFYYKYKDLQLPRLINKTSFNDNTNASIYGLEAEAVVRPDRHVTVNLSGSYLHTKIEGLAVPDTRDPSAGRSDTVIIKDLTTASNCVVRPTAAGSGALANAFVAAVNGSLGLNGPVPVPGTNTTGAYSICSALAGAIAAPSPQLRTAFGVPTGALPFQYVVNNNNTVTLPDGVPVDLTGRQLPQAPMYKFSAGIQHTAELGQFTLVSRADLSYTGSYYSRSFNDNPDRIQGYEVVNLSAQLNGPSDRYFIRGFVQNLTSNNAVTGQYLSDASNGLFTNVFLLEPRRYGVAVGFKF